MTTHIIPPAQDQPKSNRYVQEKLSMLLNRMHRHPGDANSRLASEWFEIKFLSGLLFELKLDRQTRTELDSLITLIEAEAAWLSSVPKPKKLGRIHNATAIKYILLLMRIQAEHLE